MANEQGPPPPLRDVAKIVVEFFVAAIGILYATGFLTTFTFLERFGIREAGGDFFKLKYIYVGILYAIFPATIAAPMLSLIVLKRLSIEAKRKHSAEDDLTVPLPTILLALNMLLIFYIIVCFAPPGFARKREWLVPTIFGVTIIGAVIFRIFEERAQSSKWFGKMSLWLRWTLFGVIVIVFDKYAIHGLSADLNRMFFRGGAYYFLLVCLYILVCARILKRLRRHHSNPTIRTNFLVIGAGVTASLFFLSILAFSGRVYPFISAAKGGGDFRNQAKAIIHLSEDARKHIPEGIIEDPVMPQLQTIRLVVIEETPSSIYVACPDYVDDWRFGNKLPYVTEIRRDLIPAVEYQSAWK